LGGLIHFQTKFVSMGILSWIAVITLFFYLIPFVRLVGRPVRALLGKREKERCFPYPIGLLKLGRWEYLMGPLRDRLLSLILLGILLYVWFTQEPLSLDTLLAAPFIVTYNLLAILAIRYRDGIRLRLAELARTHSNIHPEDFFNLYYIMLSPWPPPFPEEGFRLVSYTDADYRTEEKPVQTSWPLLDSVWMTNTLARMAIMAFKRIGPEYGRDAFDGLARLWGSCAAYRLKSRLQTIGLEKVPPLEGKTLLLFNHKSVLDFALNFFALGALHQSTGRSTAHPHGPALNPWEEPGPGTRHLRPRFIAARDHFIDNPFIYSWVSVGKVIENAGMIFINRQKGKGWAAMAEAAQKLVHSDVEIAVYPQGTRAFALQSPSGERLDAGFYTTFTKKTWGMPLGHLKPGTAHLILDTLILLRERGEKKLNILTVGIMGTGSAWAKRTFKIQTQVEMEFRLTSPWVLSTDLAEGIQRPLESEPTNKEESLYLQRVEEILEGINKKLLEATGWHEELRRRMAQEMEHLNFPQTEIQGMKVFLESSDREGERLPYILVDRILSLKAELWERFFRLLISLKDEKKKGDPWKALLQEVSERLLHR